MAGRKKRGEVGNTNMRISRESKVLDEIKNIFHYYLMAIQGIIQKKSASGSWTLRCLVIFFRNLILI